MRTQFGSLLVLILHFLHSILTSTSHGWSAEPLNIQPKHPSGTISRFNVSDPSPGREQARRIDFEVNSDLATNFVVAKIVTGNDVPEKIAIVVKKLRPATELSPIISNESTNADLSRGLARMQLLKAQLKEDEVDWNSAVWVPYTNSLPLDLGPGNGRRIIWVAGKWDRGSYTSRIGHHVRVFDSWPTVVITNPTTHVVSQPIIQLQGYSERPLQSIRYDVINSSRLLNEQGFVNQQEYDSLNHEFSTNYFSCYDIQLTPGTNIVVLRCQDLAGNTATTNLTYFLDLDNDKTPPMISLDQPINGHHISPGRNGTFNARGRSDDPTAKLELLVSASGITNFFEGIVERDGHFWFDDIPLGEGANKLLIAATDAAGNSSRTNLVIYKSDEVLIMDDVPEAKLHDLTVTVTGRVSPTSRRVWVNGTEAQVKQDGTWVATNVPILSPSESTAVFEGTALPLADRPQSTSPRPQTFVSIETGFSTNVVTLNPTRPACGVFRLHLAGAAGKNFILQTSSNLLDWTGVLTNRNSRPEFDFEDADVATHGCRFFRIVPIP